MPQHHHITHTNGKCLAKLVNRILSGSVPFPTGREMADMGISHDAYDILKGLLERDPRRRLGGGPEGSLAIQGHAWFDSIDLAALFDKEVEPPYVPEVDGEADTRFFDMDEADATMSIDSLQASFDQQHGTGSQQTTKGNQDPNKPQLYQNDGAPRSTHSLYSNFDGFSYYRTGSLQSSEWLP